MTELGATCIDLDTPVIQRRIGVLRSAHHKLSTASEVLVDSLKKGVSHLTFLYGSGHVTARQQRTSHPVSLFSNACFFSQPWVANGHLSRKSIPGATFGFPVARFYVTPNLPSVARPF